MGAPAVEPPNNSTWRSSALAGTAEQMLSAAVTRRARAAGALCGAGAQSDVSGGRDQPPVGGHRGGAKPQRAGSGKGKGSRGPCLQQQC